MFFAKPIPLFKDVTPNDNAINHIKRQVQQQPTSVVHVTITAAGTVVYTHTATSYSFIPSYSTITPTASSTYNETNPGTPDSNQSSSSSSPNLGAIIGGAVGGVAFIALIGLAFLFMRRSKKKRTSLPPPGGYIDDTDSYYQRGADMTSSVPAPRHLVAPLSNGGNESKYFQHDGGYYDDMISSPPGNYATNPTYYSTTNSTTSDSSPPTTVDGHTSFRRISNLNPERHVPHLKDRIEEPPHSKD
ncbi:hypothetical protein BDF21DRAFT_416845 [Thamnidium elegans]|uniref:Uncharacterized protein n=1 Tax=Thamnidium elegans TaxID=101142 RepID=A0A8H7T0Q1_9FUNG|nr:hypothetical protein INT48_009690 [Thamnidium elegans]KAI8083898.1 hypothetical protein BDF21DRAFT_416845 [Thamnidium elegans]